MLIGGRPLNLSPAGRLILIVMMIAFGFPIARFAFAQLPLFGIGRPQKLSAERTAVVLQRMLQWLPHDDPRRDIRCEEHAKTTDARGGRTGAFDYICAFLPPPAVSQTRLKVGVRVDAQSITHVSQQYPIDAPYVK